MSDEVGAAVDKLYTWNEILKYIEKRQALGEFNFKSQTVEDILQQMISLDEESRIALCMTSKRLASICRDKDLMRLVRRAQFLEIFSKPPFSVNRVNEAKRKIYGSVFSQATFERLMIIAYYLAEKFVKDHTEFESVTDERGQRRQVAIEVRTNVSHTERIYAVLSGKPQLALAFSWFLYGKNKKLWLSYARNVLSNIEESKVKSGYFLQLVNADGTVGTEYEQFAAVVYDFDHSMLPLLADSPDVVEISYKDNFLDANGNDIWVQCLRDLASKIQRDEPLYYTPNANSVIWLVRAVGVSFFSFFWNSVAKQLATFAYIPRNYESLTEENRLWVANLLYRTLEKVNEFVFYDIIYKIGSLNLFKRVFEEHGSDASMVRDGILFQNLIDSENVEVKDAETFLYAVSQVRAQKISFRAHVKAVDKLVRRMTERQQAEREEMIKNSEDASIFEFSDSENGDNGEQNH